MPIEFKPMSDALNTELNTLLQNYRQASEEAEKTRLNTAIKTFFSRVPAESILSDFDFSHLELNTELNTLLQKYRQASEEAEKTRLNTAIKTFFSRVPTESILSDFDFSHLDLSGVDFSCRKLINIKFNHCNLGAADFHGRGRTQKAIIQANFSDADCQRVDFSYCDLRGSILNTETTVFDATFKEAWLSRHVVEMLLPHARCNEAKIAEIKLDHISVKDEGLSSLDLSHIYFRHVYCAGTVFLGTTFFKTDVEGTNFKKAKKLQVNQFAKALNANSYNLPFEQTAKKRELVQKIARAIADTPLISSFFLPATKKRNTEELKEKKEAQEKQTPPSTSKKIRVGG